MTQTKDKPFCLEDAIVSLDEVYPKDKVVHTINIQRALAELIKGVKQDFKEVKLDGCEVVVYRRIGSHFGKSLMPGEAKA